AWALLRQTRRACPTHRHIANITTIINSYELTGWQFARGVVGFRLDPPTRRSWRAFRMSANALDTAPRHPPAGKLSGAGRTMAGKRIAGDSNPESTKHSEDITHLPARDPDPRSSRRSIRGRPRA